MARSFRLRLRRRFRQAARMAKAPAVKWTREHFFIALNLYCKLPFGKLHKGNPILIETAIKVGRPQKRAGRAAVANPKHKLLASELWLSPINWDSIDIRSLLAGHT